jgi:N-acetylmuramoyl-L-alanine amidase
MKKILYLVIHCTATPEGRAVTADDIRRMHLSPVEKGGRGWKQVGYSDMVMPDGTIVNLVPRNDNEYVEPWEITNGVAGINNVSRHIVYVGGCDKNMKPKDTRTERQKIMLTNYVHGFIMMHPDILVAGHNQFDNKACPSFDVPEWLRQINVAEKNIYRKN